MALTEFQRSVLRVLAQGRIRSGESYVAGGTALNELIQGARRSRDIDLFHDTEEALRSSWDSDRKLLQATGHRIDILRERPAYVEALVSKGEGRVLIQWTCDSAFRFFPLLAHPELGLTLHPFDLATNKVLALVGRLEARDWVDAIHSSDSLQPLGYLIWAASGKDPGLGPAMVLSEAHRSGRHTAEELAELAFEGPAPDFRGLSRRWTEMLAEAERIVDLLPAESAGKCVLEKDGSLFRGDRAKLERAVTEGLLQFHGGSIRGAFPTIKSG
jgi:hypothetical protein